MEYLRLLQSFDHPTSDGVLAHRLRLLSTCLSVSQYITKLNSEKVAKVMHKMGTKGLARRRLNFQLCDDSDGDITGYKHNAVVPVLLKTRMPIIISSAIAKLDAFWMGGGEVHKKLWVRTDAFLGAYRDEISVEDIAYM